MLDLLRDPNAIRFTDGKRIHLKLLKNQIDRRILKITAFAAALPASSRPYTERPVREAACQASIDSANFSIEMSRCSKRALGDLNGNDLIALGKREKPKWQRNESSNYLIMAGSGLKVLNRSRQESKQQGRTQAYQDEGAGKQVSSDNSCELNLDLSNIKFDENISYEDQANQLKSYIRNTLSNRKKTMTDRSKVQVFHGTKTLRVMGKKQVDAGEARMKESRIMVSCGCMQRMQAELNAVVAQRRQYQMDYKARANLLKKVQQKYKNDIM